MMNKAGSRALLAGAIFSAVAALLHVGCLVFGAPWYRFLGAGERMARMAERGHWYPAAVTTAIICILSVWALYASSGAGLIRPLPFLRVVLFAIGAVYLLRGLGAAVLVPYFPGNSLDFWLVTSAVCTVAGALHLIGLKEISSKR
ncbi:MAG TPA: hypothetical protein VF883_05810 [Thermoanaerobaculia bacterium]|jgi:hypothetical protein